MRIGTSPVMNAAIATLLAAVGSAMAGTVIIEPDRDTTLYESSPSVPLSNGQGVHVFAGRTGTYGDDSIRRALMRFDIDCFIPPRATIINVFLTLHMSQAPLPNPTPQDFCLSRVLADWGEGASDTVDAPGGAGAPAEPGDATWQHSFFPTVLWAFDGGDFAITLDACTSVGAMVGSFVWSSEGMTENVQSWLDQPAANYGWMIRGNELDERTARRFDSREIGIPEFRPTLEIQFVDPPPCPGDANGDGMVNIDDIVAVVLAFDEIEGECLLIPDVDDNGQINIDDIVTVVLNFGNDCT